MFLMLMILIIMTLEWLAGGHVGALEIMHNNQHK